MLILSRQENESICIDGRTVEVVVVSIRGNKVRLGIKAPEGMTVHRGEVQERIEQEQAEQANIEQANHHSHPQPQATP